MRKLFLLIIVFILITACSIEKPSEIKKTELANPASVFCEEQGGNVEIRTSEEGSQSGYCIFSNGSECEEWAFFRGECSPEVEK